MADPGANASSSMVRSTGTLDVRARAWVLAATAACLLPLLLQLPGHFGIGIGIAAAAVMTLSLRWGVPTWFRLVLVVAALAWILASTRFGIGRDTGCALLAAMLALKPAELRGLRDARSLLGFALFAPFSTFLLDQGPLSLLLGLCGALLVLLSLLHLSERESNALTPSGASASLRRLALVGRLVVIGLPLALAVFWLFPRIATPLWGVPERALARPGLSDRMAPGEWLDILTDDSPALRATFSGPEPSRETMYWRGPVLTDFDGRAWTQSGWMRNLPPADVVPSSARFEYELEVEPTDRRQLVALELPLDTPDGVRRSLDHGLFVSKPLSSLTRWQMRSSPPAAFEPELKTTLRRIALHLPDGFNPRTLALARRWRADAGGGVKGDTAIVERALQWVRSDFAYTLDTPLPGRHSVDEFLFDQQYGFCEHFSSSFVVLMRAAGIPARVVTGYVGGYYNRYGGYWLVRRSDAHAWAEVWLEGRGWVRVDPTAAVAPERIYDTLQDRAGDAAGGFAPMLDMGDWMRRGWNDLLLGFDSARQRRMLQPLGLDDLSPGLLVGLFALAAALAVSWMLWLSSRGERERDPVLRAWRRLCARHARLGLARAPYESAGDWAARVAAAHPQAAALPDLAARFAHWRYAHRAGGRLEQRSLVRDLRAYRPGRPPRVPSGEPR
jgi:protein-glutamine gamma-glutamyltransferase